jgi:hypothetical protein
MLTRKIASLLLVIALGGGLGACDDGGETEVEGGPGQSREEDPTLENPEGGATPDEGPEGTAGDTSDGSDEGTPGSGGGDNGSGSGSGRGDG